MLAIRISRTLILLAASALIVAGCGGGGGGGAGSGDATGQNSGDSGDTGGDTGAPPADTTSPPGETTGDPAAQGDPNTTAALTLTAFDSTGLSGGVTGLRALARALSSATLTTVDGVILGILKDVDGAPLKIVRYTTSLEIDPSAPFVDAQVMLNFPPGAWDFYFILNAPNGRHYGGISTDFLVLDSTTNLTEIRFLMSPVIGDSVNDVADLAGLSRLPLNYSNLSLSDLANPNTTIRVDGGSFYAYSINRGTGFASVLLNLPVGTHTLEIRFFDGGTLVSVPIIINVLIPPGGGDLPPSVVVPNEVTVTPTPDATGMTLSVVVPGLVVNAVGVDNVSAVFTVEDQGTVLYETELPFDQESPNYEWSVPIANLHPGPVTWSIQFFDLRTDPPELYAYCAQAIEFTVAGATVVCALNLPNPVEPPPGDLIVTVNVDGARAGGAIVSANGEVIGITSDGTAGTGRGQLEVFLQPGSYVLTVRLAGSSVTQTLNIQVVSEQTVIQDFNFISPDTTAPVVTILSPIDGDVVATSTPVLSFSSNEPGVAEVKIDGVTVVANALSPLTLGPLDDGIYVLTVSVTDAVGNTGTATATFEVDSISEGCWIESPAEGELFGVNTVSLTFACNVAGTAEVFVGNDYVFSKQLKSNGAGKYSFTQDVGPLADGKKTLFGQVQIWDKSYATAQVKITVDTTKPIVNVTSPAGTTPDHQPVLHYTPNEPIKPESVIVKVGDVEVQTRDGEPLPNIVQDGTYTVTVTATDKAGNTGSGASTFTIETPPPVQALSVTAQYFRRPTLRVDGEVALDGTVPVRIPSPEQLEVLAGNDQRYVLFLTLGDIHCVYLGGSFSSYQGDLDEEVPDREWFRQLRSPICGLGRYHAGDVVNVSGSIRARVLFGDFRYTETTIRVTIDVAEGNDAGASRHGHWGWVQWHDGRWHWGWRD